MLIAGEDDFAVFRRGDTVDLAKHAVEIGHRHKADLHGNIDDLRSMVDRFLRLSEAHEMEIEALMQKIKTAPALPGR